MSDGIVELPVFPQITLSNSQGKIGTRKWKVRHDKLDDFLTKVCASHWPGDKYTLCTAVQSGCFDEKVVVKEGEIGSESSSGNDTQMGPLPIYGENLVVAQYQFLLASKEGELDGHGLWPIWLPQPKHPEGTTLSVRVRGSGQFLVLPPEAGHWDSDGSQKALTHNDNFRMLIPIAEFHVTCDRLKKADVPHWSDLCEGRVNPDHLMGYPKECMLFDSFDLDHSSMPDVKQPARYKATCVLRSRVIHVPHGEGIDGGSYVGWNHDYYATEKKWTRILIGNEDRYPRGEMVTDENLFMLMGGGGWGDSSSA